MPLEQTPRFLDLNVGSTPVSAALALTGPGLTRWLAGGTDADLHALLSDAERETLSTKTVRKRRQEWLAGRIAAKALLLRHLGLELDRAGQVEVLADEDRRPVAHGLAPDGSRTPIPLSVSISHRGGAVGAALATAGSVGLDIEVMEPRSEALLADHFTGREASMMGGLGGEEGTFAIALFWSVKEAGLKAAGVGLSVPAADAEVVRLDPGDRTGTLALGGQVLDTSRLDLVPGDDGRLHCVFRYVLEPPYLVSLASVP